ncbi:hypothetical protein [Lactococcus lactis]|uniref:hypothetical protein n=1 Tax=Lactococcus lactis TaxID=1358 RepID=UPI003D0A8EA8
MDEEYISGELKVMPQMVKNNYLRIIKTLIKEERFSSKKDKVDSLIKQGNIDLFLETILREEKELFLETKFNYTLIKGFKYGALFQLDDDREIQDILAQISDLAQNNSEVNVVQTEKMVIYSSNLNGMKIREDVERVKSTYSVAVKFWQMSPKDKFVEIDVPNIGAAFRLNKPTFFTDQVDQIVSKFQDEYLISLDPIDLSEVIYAIKDRNKSNPAKDIPRASAQKMILNSGAEATLDSNNTEEIILPILGELKILIERNSELFDKSPEIKELIDDFIQDTEVLSYLPWIALTWNNIVKSKRMKVKFILDSSNEYTLLNYYSHTNGREGLNDVVESILKEYCTIRNPEEEKALPAIG